MYQCPILVMSPCNPNLNVEGHLCILLRYPEFLSTLSTSTWTEESPLAGLLVALDGKQEIDCLPTEVNWPMQTPLH